MNNRFKHTEIGEIPDDWETIALEEGLSLLKDGSHNPPKRVKNGIKFIAGASDVKYLNIDFNDCTYISEKDYNVIHKYYEIKENDVLLTIVGTVGNVAIVKKEDLPFSLQRSIAILRCGDKIDYRFLFYWLTSPIFRQFLYSRLNPTAQPGIYLGELGKLKMPLPPLPTQRAIAKILSGLDEKIELNRQMNKTLESIAHAIFKRWFIDFEFPDKNGNSYKSSGGKIVESELGEIPKDWSVDNITSVCEITDCLHTKKPERSRASNKYLLQVYNIGELFTLDLETKYYVSEKDYDEWTKNIEVKEGDIIITNAAKTGAIAQIPYDFTGGIGRNVTAIRPRKIPATYLLEYLVSSHGISEIGRNLDYGTIFDSLNVKGIRKINILVPNTRALSIYNKIGRYLRYYIEKNTYENQFLRNIRDSILPKLMSGKIRINE